MYTFRDCAADGASNRVWKEGIAETECVSGVGGSGKWSRQSAWVKWAGQEGSCVSRRDGEYYHPSPSGPRGARLYV